jgi:hypothetical protein
MCLALALRGHQLTKTVWEYINDANKKLKPESEPKPEPEPTSVTFIKVKTGEMVFWRGDLPHRHVKHRYNSSIIHGNMKFGACVIQLDGSVMSTSKKWLTDYIIDDNTKLVEGTNVKPVGYGESCFLYYI